MRGFGFIGWRCDALSRGGRKESASTADANFDLSEGRAQMSNGISDSTHAWDAERLAIDAQGAQCTEILEEFWEATKDELVLVHQVD